MSRHTVRITKPRAGETHAVIGYDRMLDQYFVQIYTTADVGDEVTREFEDMDLRQASVMLDIPGALLFLLRCEAAGLSEPSVCRDWRARAARVVF